MKNSFIILITVLAITFLNGQPPQKMSYQSVMRDGNGILLANQNVGLKISIIRGNPAGMEVFSETHVATTNSNGLISLVIGDGENAVSSITNIDWSLGPYYLNLEVDPDGGNQYSISGINELLSVPYALYSEQGGGDTDWVEDMANNLVYTDNNIALLSGGSYPFRINRMVAAGEARVEAGTNAGIGVLGISGIGYGVRGESNQGVGLHGLVKNFGTGVRGEADSGFGIEGLSKGGPGIFGKSELTHSIQGQGVAAEMAGIFGTSKLGFGIIGRTDDASKAGVLGDGKNLSDGVIGTTNIIGKSGVVGDGKSDGRGVLGMSINQEGIKGTSIKLQGVIGFTETHNGVEGETDFDSKEENITPGNIGKGTVVRSGVLGKAQKSNGVIGRSAVYSGVMGFSVESNGILAGTDTDKRDHAAVLGGAMYTHGVLGHSVNANGVLGKTEATEFDVDSPSNIRSFDEKNNSAIMGLGSFTYGVIGQSFLNAGIYGFSESSNGITGATNSAGVDEAGVLGLSKSGNGIVGWSDSGSGVKGKSTTGRAGEFEGEVHIENGSKNAKLKIEMMEDDLNAPCLVWSGDKYVRKRDCWTIEEENGIEYFVSSKGIKLKDGDNTVFQVNPDGTSLHKGLETFEGGIAVPMSEGYNISMSPENGISINNPETNDFIWHADNNGNTYAKNSLTTVFVIANSIAAGSLDATVVSANVKQFKIDHPLDPENKFLIHSSIESDERLNMYSGNIKTDENGLATVHLPEWFEALNTDFRYSLTVLGTFAQAIIKEEVYQSAFVIQTNLPGTKVSWQITGVRHDKWALENPVKIEIPKLKMK